MRLIKALLHIKRNKKVIIKMCEIFNETGDVNWNNNTLTSKQEILNVLNQDLIIKKPYIKIINKYIA